MNTNADQNLENSSPLSTLGRLILTRMIANRKPPTRADFVKDLKPLFSADLRGTDSDWKQLVYRTLEELALAERITDPARNIRITEQGRADLRAFLQVDSLPEQKTWSVIKKVYLTSLAIGQPPTPGKTADKLKTSDGFKAAMLVKLFGLRLNAVPSLPLAIHALAVQQGLKPQKQHPEALRDAFLENWINSLDAAAVFAAREVEDPVPGSTIPSPGTASPGTASSNTASSNTPGLVTASYTAAGSTVSDTAADSSQQLRQFVARVKEIARSLRDESTGPKILISRIWQRFQETDASPAMTRSEFDEQLLHSNREQLLTLSRADLVGHLSPEDRRDSEIHPESGGQFHFVRTDRD